MFRLTNPQFSMLESQFLVPPAKRARLEKSWAHPFRTRILPLINEELFRACFHTTDGRPNKSIRLLTGLHLLKEWEDLTDAQVLDQLEYNLQWHYALGVEPGSAHICQKTLHTYRANLMKNERAQEMFEAITHGLAETDGLDLGRQRLDSTHVISNIALLTRLGLFVETVTHFMQELRREYPEKLDDLEHGYVKRYLEREGYFADAKREQARRRLPAVALDVCRLVRAFEQDKAVCALESYQLLVRLFEEQCEVVEASEEEPPAVSVDEASHPAEPTEESPVEPTEESPVEPTEEGPVESTEEGPVEPTEEGPVEPEEGVIGEPELAVSHDDIEESTTGQPPCAAVEPTAQQTEPTTADEKASGAVKLKEPKTISTSSLQSPYDPDASYGRKGKGYEVQIVESCAEDNPYQVITGVALNGANESDQHALLPMAEQLERSSLKPTLLFADTGYGSGQNIIDCAQMGIDLQAPVQDPHAPEPTDPWVGPVEVSAAGCAPEESLPPSSSTPGAEPGSPMDLDAFTFNTTFDEVTACPRGREPFEQHLDKAGRTLWAKFSTVSCEGCPMAERCPTRRTQAGYRTLRCRTSKAATAHRQRQQQTKQFKEQYKIRSGVESTNAELKGRHGANDIRVRRQERVTLSMRLKAMTLNAKRAVQYHTQRLRERTRSPEAAFAPAGG